MASSETSPRRYARYRESIQLQASRESSPDSMDHCMKPTPASPHQSVPSQSNTATAGWMVSMRWKKSEEERVEIFGVMSGCAKTSDLIKNTKRENIEGRAIFRCHGAFTSRCHGAFTSMMQHRRKLRQLAAAIHQLVILKLAHVWRRDFGQRPETRFDCGSHARRIDRSRMNEPASSDARVGWQS